MKQEVERIKLLRELRRSSSSQISDAAIKKESNNLNKFKVVGNKKSITIDVKMINDLNGNEISLILINDIT